jgi:glycosyltransferase involved in cell wall biosynthesis
MMNKPTLIYVIDNLGRGGAETLLVGILPEIASRFNIILVTLSDLCEFGEEELVCSKMYSLGFSGKLSFLTSIVKLKKIISYHKPQIVHAHLLNSSIIARLACPPGIHLAYSLHSILSLNAFNNSWMYRNIEKKIFNRQHWVVAVSYEVLKDYETTIGKSVNSFILKNYISDAFLKTGLVKKMPDSAAPIKMVAVGNIKKVKNYEYLLDSLMGFKEANVVLDIYGKGEPEYLKILQQKIDDHDLPVTFKGLSRCIDQLLPTYDLYVMSSSNEGFGLAAIEAMASGLPLLLSDVPVLREVTFDNALFFNNNNPASFADLLQDILAGKHNLEAMKEKGKAIVETNYTKKQYIAALGQIYGNMLLDNK